MPGGACHQWLWKRTRRRRSRRSLYPSRPARSSSALVPSACSGMFEGATTSERTVRRLFGHWPQPSRRGLLAFPIIRDGIKRVTIDTSRRIRRKRTPHARFLPSFPRSAWECRLRRSASSGPAWAPERSRRHSPLRAGTRGSRIRREVLSNLMLIVDFKG